MRLLTKQHLFFFGVLSFAYAFPNTHVNAFCAKTNRGKVDHHHYRSINCKQRQGSCPRHLSSICLSNLSHSFYIKEDCVYPSKCMAMGLRFEGDRTGLSFKKGVWGFYKRGYTIGIFIALLHSTISYTLLPKVLTR